MNGNNCMKRFLLAALICCGLVAHVPVHGKPADSRDFMGALNFVAKVGKVASVVLPIVIAGAIVNYFHNPSVDSVSNIPLFTFCMALHDGDEKLDKTMLGTTCKGKRPLSTFEIINEKGNRTSITDGQACTFLREYGLFCDWNNLNYRLNLNKLYSRTPDKIKFYQDLYKLAGLQAPDDTLLMKHMQDCGDPLV